MKCCNRFALVLLLLFTLAGTGVAQTRVFLLTSSDGRGSGPFTSSISTPLVAAGYTVRTWNQSSSGWPRLDTLLAYDAVFFHCSERSRAKFVDSTLTAYAQQGGRLVVEGTNVAQWANVYPLLNKRVTHAKWRRANVTNYTYEVLDPSHMLTAGLPATFASAGYANGYQPDAVQAEFGGHAVLGYQNSDGAAAVIVYPRSVFFAGSLHRVTNTGGTRDSLIVRSVRWVLQNPVDAAVYDLNYQLGHRSGETIPVTASIMNWATTTFATGRMVLEASPDSAVWTRVDSVAYNLEPLSSNNFTLNWQPDLPQYYYLRAVLQPNGTDALAASDQFPLRVTTLFEGVHPRMFYTEGEVGAMRSRATGTHAGYVNALRTYINENLNYNLPAPQSWPMASISQISTLLATGSLLAVLDPQPQYLNFAKRMAMGLCQYPSWGTGFYDQDLYPARGCFALALTYDWLFAEYTPAQRDTIKLKLAMQLAKLDAAYDQYVWWATALHHNHHWQSTDHLGAAALCLLGEEPEAPLWHERARTSVDQRFTFYGPVEDGSWYEAMNYWGLITWGLLPHLYLLREQAGIDYFDTPFVRNLATYRLYGAMPALGRMPMINEAQEGEWYGPMHQLALLAREYRDGEVQWLRARLVENEGYSVDSPMDFFFYDPTVPETPPTDLAKIIPDQDTYFGRSSWASQALWVSLKCGLPTGRHAYETYWSPGGAIGVFDYSHFHPDQNAFTLCYNGRYLVQSGGLQYPVHFTRNSTTLLINGQGQIGDSMLGAWPLPSDRFAFNPHLEKFFGTLKTDYVIGDATSAYPASLGLEQFQRHLLFIRPNTLVLVDRVQTASPRSFTFMLQHRQNIWTSNASRVLLTDGPVAATMHVLEPAEWTTSSNFTYYYQTQWGGYNFRLNAADTDTTMRFFTVFHPVQNGQEARVQMLASTPDHAAMRLRAAGGYEATALLRFTTDDSVTVDSLRTDAEVAVVLRDSTAGVITGATVQNGRFLRWGADHRLLYSAPDTTLFEWEYRADTLRSNGRLLEGTVLWAPLTEIVVHEGHEVEFARDGEYIILEAAPIPPALVPGLTISSVGDSVRLRWQHVRTDEAGYPVTLTSYAVYRTIGYNGGRELVCEIPPTDSTCTIARLPSPLGNVATFFEVRARTGLTVSALRTHRPGLHKAAPPPASGKAIRRE